MWNLKANIRSKEIRANCKPFVAELWRGGRRTIYVLHVCGQTTYSRKGTGTLCVPFVPLWMARSGSRRVAIFVWRWSWWPKERVRCWSVLMCAWGWGGGGGWSGTEHFTVHYNSCSIDKIIVYGQHLFKIVQYVSINSFLVLLRKSFEFVCQLMMLF